MTTFNAVAARDRVTRGLAFFPALLTRLVLGYGLLMTGWGKWTHLTRTTSYFGTLHIPDPHAVAALVAGVEVIGGALLIVGLLTRLSALVLLIDMTCALLIADLGKFVHSWSPASNNVPVDITSFTYGLLLLWLCIYGGGVMGLDGFMLARRRVASEPKTTTAEQPQPIEVATQKTIR